MGEALKERIKQYRFESPAQEAVLNLMVAADTLRYESEKAMARFGMTPPQYNVLRILRGIHPNGHPRGEIAQRMVERAPDVTRLIDRLEQQGLVARDRSDEDKRMSITKITKKGLRLLEEMQPAMDELESIPTERLSTKELRDLSSLLEKLYSD